MMNTTTTFPGGMTEAEFDALCRDLEDPAEAVGVDKPLLRLDKDPELRVYRPGKPAQ